MRLPTSVEPGVEPVDTATSSSPTLLRKSAIGMAMDFAEYSFEALLTSASGRERPLGFAKFSSTKRIRFVVRPVPVENGGRSTSDPWEGSLTPFLVADAGLRWWGKGARLRDNQSS